MRKNEERVLKYLNRLRKKYEIGEPLAELPPDLPFSDDRELIVGCPVAVMLEVKCGTGAVMLYNPETAEEDKVVFPAYVAKFQEDHDRRRILGLSHA